MCPKTDFPMAKYDESENTADNLGRGGHGSVPLESILCTAELQRRPSRSPDHEQESRALVALAEALSESPRTILQTLADTILNVCRAGSAGISLLSKEDGGQRFYWPAIAGEWKAHIGGGTPRDFGPCGDVLDRNAPLLMRRLQRRYTYFEPVKPPAEEALLVPFYVQGKAVGTIWAVAHNDRKFDAEDERLMKSLGTFASSAYQTWESEEALALQMADILKAEQTAGLLAAIIESSDDAIISKSLSGVITSWTKSAEKLFGYASEEAVGKSITLIIPSDRQDEETAILERLRKGEKIEHFETIRRRKDGTTVDISLTISPVKNARGVIVGASKVARDITHRKHADQALRESEERLRTLAQGLESQVQLRTQQLEERNADVLQQTEELRELSKRLLLTQDAERRRIARDLHDSVGQIVAALGMNFTSIAQNAVEPETRKAAQEGHELISQLSKEIRTISYLLHPPLLDESGLSEPIRWFMAGLSERSGLKIDLDISKDFGRLPGDVEVAIFRIVQECLTNIHRHSNAKTAIIGLRRDASTVSLQVQDDGSGIPKETLAAIRNQRSGVGITRMRERVRHLGGTLDIQSSSHGTKVSVTIPLT